MTTIGKHIAAFGTTATAIIIAATAFPAISSSVQAEYKMSATEAKIIAVAEKTPLNLPSDISYWLDQAESAVPFAVTSDPVINTALMAETQCLAEAIYYEARSETRSGQRAVGEVIKNRVASKHFPNSVCGVVYEGSQRKTGCQFTFTCDGSMDAAPKGKAWDRSVRTAKTVMTGGYTPITNYATHYHTLEVSPKWSATLRMTRRVGSHVFYRFAPRNYVPSEPSLLVAPPI